MATKKYTVEELLIMLAEAMPNPTEVTIDKKFEDQIFAQLAQIEGIDDYLRETLGFDMQRYFNVVTDIDRAMVKGGYHRVAYFLGKIYKARINKANASD